MLPLYAEDVRDSFRANTVALLAPQISLCMRARMRDGPPHRLASRQKSSHGQTCWLETRLLSVSYESVVRFFTCY